MIEKRTYNKTFLYRSTLLFFLFSALFSVIFFRLIYLQWYQADYFKTAGREQYTKKIVVHPMRKSFFDNHKIPLTYNHFVESAFVLLPQCTQREQLVTFLNQFFPAAAERLEKRPRQFLWIKRTINSHESELCKKAKIPGLHIVEESRRFCPYPFLAPVLGTTSIDNSGIEGLELYYDSYIKGFPSSVLIQKDARTNTLYFTRELLQKGEKGKAVELTIDCKLSKKVYEELKKTVQKFSAQSGAVLIMDAKTGAIISMVSYPIFDEKNLLIRNNVIQDCYEFGSVIKPLVALAALEEKVVTSDEKIDCEGTVAYVAQTRVENIRPLFVIPFSDVVRFSSNVGMAKIGVRLGERMYDYLARYGFGIPSGVDYPGERAGYLSPPSKWSRSTPVVLSFGYEMNATLLQLARAYAVLGNDGCLVTPHFKKNDIVPKSQPLFSQAALEGLRTILKEGNSSIKRIPNFVILGKTGTARIATPEGYSRERHLYTFAGLVERENYRRVIITFIKEPTDPMLLSSQITAPLFSRIAHMMVMHDILHNHLAH